MYDLLKRIEQHLLETNTTASRFGRAAAGDPRLVFDLRSGRAPKTDKLQSRIQRYLLDPAPAVPSRATPVWDAAKLERLWTMAAQGISRADIAAAFDVSVSAVANQLTRLAEQRLPHRPKHMRLEQAIAETRLQSRQALEASL